MVLLEMILGWFGPFAAAVLWIFTAIASWRVFVKAGVAGWKSLIPVYREYQLFCIAWDKKQFLPYLGVAVIASALEAMAGRVGDTSIYGAIGAVVDIVVIYYEVMLKLRLAYSFGRSRAFGLFLYFLEPLGMIALSYGPDEYLGPKAKPED